MAPAGKTPETGTGPCGGLATNPLQSSGAQERCPIRAFKETDVAPRGALPYPRLSREEFGGIFLDLMPYLEPKGEGNSSMAANQ